MNQWTTIGPTQKVNKNSNDVQHCEHTYRVGSVLESNLYFPSSTCDRIPLICGVPVVKVWLELDTTHENIISHVIALSTSFRLLCS